ncbi:Eco57I restriction-modification methylase domain-containing protein [Aliarcobacter skirrowii]|uniref:Eco57I restriction-modification methylase domain-containing protein n=1 Tax=Aliarcobacter skirrowii TaxID=28200 RepID=UPI0029A177A2|nr:TaqI-like C-terminal specificity domain-containing protein [Aliarcobacter skirrowii]MDX4038448.1 TaqI-like C-terminal specificity domain-containing protein [Aliarcobacter skirrowii]
MSIFQNSVLKTFKQDEKLVAQRWAAFQNYKAKVEAIKDFKEEEYQDGFLKDIFESCLGYTLKTTNPSSFNLEREKKNETDSKKADGVIYLNSEIIAVIELKDTKTKNLDRVQQQAFWYLTQHTKAKYVIISNFDELRFYFDKSTAYESFSLFNLSYDDFCKLHLLLSFENIKDETALKIKEKSNSFEQDISKKLYKDFSHFRTLLFENIVKNNLGNEILIPSVLNGEVKTSLPNQQTLLRLTQKLCDRIIFILFAEDRDLLRANMIKEIREEFINQKFTNYSLYDIYKFYFDAINKGNDKLQIPQYNGGLFASDELLDSLIIDDYILDENVQILSNYDFASEISVNILGHIFEQSLTDLEELQANIDNVNFDKTKSKRKKDGVFYTPEYITRYIVENTLGKMCSEKREELKIGSETLASPSNPKKLTKQEQQTKENLQEYKNWLLNLKILDPACGSGAFLNQALEYLISEHKNLQNDLALMGDLFASYMVEEEILEHNLYGVDINEDAVEIAKLSLWLRTAKRGRPLTKLVDKIKCGNSLIDDKSVVSNAFVWEDEFKEVFENGGFDIVIGNPPYITFALGKKQEFSEKEIEYYKNKFPLSSAYKVSSYLIFIEKSLGLISKTGLLSFIVPNAIYTNYFYSNFREYLIDNFSIHSLFNLEYEVFEDADTGGSSIFVIGKDEIENTILLSSKSEKEYSIPYIFKLNQNEFKNIPDNKFLFSDSLISLWNKSFENSIALGSDNFQFYNGIKTGDNKKFLSEEQLDDRYRPIIRGRDFYKYTPLVNEMYVLFDPEQLWSNTNESMYLVDEKLIFRQTSDHLVVAYDNNRNFTMDTTHLLFDKSQTFNHKYLLSVLNSKLLNFLYQIIVPEIGKAFSEVKGVNLKKLPIKEISLKEQEPFIKKADLMLELNKKLQELKQNFINELNLEKVPTKLQKFEELDFDDFVKEYAKAKKLKFADKLEERNFKNEWQRLFENDKKEVLEIQNQINITDKEIDQMVYKLYDLTEDEIKIVEGV